MLVFFFCLLFVDVECVRIFSWCCLFGDVDLAFVLDGVAARYVVMSCYECVLRFSAEVVF